jgi:hypothetical protein
MRRLLYLVTAIIAIPAFALLFAGRGQAADLNVYKRQASRSDCGPSGCGWHHLTYRCPDRLSCYPLYGAYGPYGGAAYWDVYSYGYYPTWGFSVHSFRYP